MIACMDAARNTLRDICRLSAGNMRIEMKILLNWSPLRQLFTYIQERFTFLVLLCWPAIIWLFCRVGVWLMDNVYELLGKSPAQSFTVYLQPFMTPGTLLRTPSAGLSYCLSCLVGDGLHLGFTSLYESP